MFEALLEYVKGLFGPPSVASIVKDAQAIVDRLGDVENQNWDAVIRVTKKIESLSTKRNDYEDEATKAASIAARWQALVNG